jgi:hypothetical protein
VNARGVRGGLDVPARQRGTPDLAHLAIVIVGDKAIEAPLKATGIAPVVDVGIDGKIGGQSEH